MINEDEFILFFCNYVLQTITNNQTACPKMIAEKARVIGKTRRARVAFQDLNLLYKTTSINELCRDVSTVDKNVADISRQAVANTFLKKCVC